MRVLCVEWCYCLNKIQFKNPLAEATPTSYMPLSRRLDRCDRVTQSEAKYPFGGNVYYITMQITLFMRKFRNGQRNLHCDVLHITTKWVFRLDSGFARKECNLHCDVHVATENEHILPPFGSLAIQTRRLDRCDRMIQNESRNSNGGNVRLFTAATCTSQCK